METSNQEVVELFKSLARLEEGQKNQHERLFNGGAGVIPSLYKRTDELAAKLESLTREIDKNRLEALSAAAAAATAASAAATASQSVATSIDLRIENSQSEIKQKLAWIWGAAASAGAVLAFLGKWLISKVPFTHYP